MFRSTLVTFLLLVTTGSLTAQFFVAEKTVPRRLTRVAWRGQTGTS